MFANTPKPPYYAVIFTSIRKPKDNGYSDMALKMLELASKEEGFLGAESAKEDIGITVSYWQNLEAIKNWKENSFHQEAQKLGQKKWYASYKIRITKVEKDYEFKNKEN